MKTLRNGVKILFVAVLALCTQRCWAHMMDSQEAGKALKLDGQGDFVVIPHAQSLDISGPFAIEVWLKYDSAVFREAAVLAKGSIGREWAGYALIVSNDGHVTFFSGKDRSQHLISNSTISPHHWYHVACVLRGDGINRAEIWLNGFLDGSGTLEYPPSTLEAVYMGQWNESLPYCGEIDEARIYNRALTEEEIWSEMGFEIRDRKGGIVAHYDFNELTPGGNVKDLSPHNNHGTFHGNAMSVLSDAPVCPSDKGIGRTAELFITRTEDKVAQLKMGHVEMSCVLEHLSVAKNAFQNKEFKAAFRYAHSAQSKLDEAWDILQNYVSLRKEVESEVTGLKKREIDISFIDRKISRAEEALQEEDFERARMLMNDAKSKAHNASITYQQIEKLRESIEEVEELGCDVGKAEKKMGEAVDAFYKGGYSRVEEYVQDGIRLTKQADCSRVKVMNLIAQAAKYDGKTVEIKGRIKNIETIYTKGHKMAVDDGTGLIWVEYAGSMKELDYWNDLDYLDNVIIEGIFSERNASITATEVR